MHKTKLKIIYYFFIFIPLYFFLILNGFNNLSSIIIAIITLIINIYLLYLEFLKIINKMQFKKISSSDSFLHSLYFLSFIVLILGVFLENLEVIRLGFAIYLFALIFVNMGTVYYDDKTIILGSDIIIRENISNIEMKNGSIFIEYDNGVKRKMKFFTKVRTQNIFNFLKEL